MPLDIQSFADRYNIKITRNRALIMEVIFESDDHPTAEEIYDRACKIEPRIGIATIYRTLTLLEECGAVRKLTISGDKSRYEISHGAHEHYHLIDVKDGTIVEFELPEMEQIKTKIAEKFGYRIVECRFDLYGVQHKEDRADKSSASTQIIQSHIKINKKT